MIQRLQEFELPCIPINYVSCRPLTSTGDTVVIRGGQHPKMRLIGGRIRTIAHQTTAPVINVKSKDGTTIATATASATVGASVELTFSAQTGRDLTVFNEQQDVTINVGTAGAANSIHDVTLEFVIENSAVPGN